MSVLWWAFETGYCFLRGSWIFRPLLPSAAQERLAYGLITPGKRRVVCRKRHELLSPGIMYCTYIEQIEKAFLLLTGCTAG